MVGIVCKAVLLLLFSSLGSSVVVDSSNATSILTGDADSSDQPDGFSADDVVDDTASLSLIAPEKGDALPEFAKTFPGCSCEWNEGFKSGYSCENDILAPDSMAGKNCCCCTTDCLSEHRCSNDECLMLGVDQAAEIEAERIAAEKAAKESPIPPSQFGSAKMTLVRLPQGDCTSRGPLDACKKQGLYPMCFSHSKGRQRDGGKPGCKVTNRGRTMKCDQEQNCWWFADYPKHPYSHMSFENLKNFGINPAKFGGFCMYAANGGTNQGLVLNGKGPAAWAPNNPKSRAAYKITGADGKEWTANEQSAMGWQTVCVNEKPEPYPPQYRR